MNNMNKIFTVIGTAAVAAMVLSACGGNGATKSASSSPAASTAAPAAASGGTKEITLVAKNFEFDQKEIHVKKGDKIKLTLKNGAGAHGVEIPDLNVKLSSAGSTEFTADKAGEFEFDCALMCGTGHDKMVGKLIVE